MTSPRNRAVARSRHRPVARSRQRRRLRLLAGGAVALGGAALLNLARSRAAEATTPPPGRFVEVDGVRVHYTEHGAGRDGPPIVLIHGNFSMVQDFELSDVTHRLALKHRVLVFDRPGCGYTGRPGDGWTAERQAALLVAAAALLDAERPVVVGHSWGTLPALAWALDHPERIGGLVLMSGYYYPQPRADVMLQKMLMLPGIGALIRWTVAPIQLRLGRRLGERQIFGPSPTNTYFTANFPWELAARPSQLRATFADTAHMDEAAARLAPRFGELTLPMAIVGGTGDRLVDFDIHAARLARDLPHALLVALPGAGHMVHHIEPGPVTDAITATAIATRAATEPLMA